MSMVSATTSHELQNDPVAARTLLVAGLEWSRQNFGDGDRRHSEAQSPCRVPVEKRLEAAGEFRMAFEEIDDRSRIHQEQRVARQASNV